MLTLHHCYGTTEKRAESKLEMMYALELFPHEMNPHVILPRVSLHKNLV